MKKYVFKPYCALYPELFQKEKRRLASHLKRALAVEHVGSTAVLNLGGKGIIDIAIAVKKEDMEEASLLLQNLGYEFKPHYSTPDRFYYIADLPDPEETQRRYHLHVTYLESQDWKGLIDFRDYLRNHPDASKEYEALKMHAAEVANNSGEDYRKIKGPIFEKIKTLNRITFKKASLKFKDHVQRWLEEPHVRESWDNNPEHFQDVVIFMEGRKDPSSYWNGMFDYWIGFFDEEPYCLFMTSEVLPSQSDLSQIWKRQLSTLGRTFSIDFMIGNTKYLGKGLAKYTLQAFTQFIAKEIDLTIDTFLIDPAVSNPRGKRVYEQAGFKVVDTFHRDFGEEKNVEHFLMVKKI